MIWIQSATEAWVPVEVVFSDNKSVTIKTEGGKQAQIPGARAKYDEVTMSALNEDCDNLVNLETFNEGIILHHVKKRYVKDGIYTFVGDILIALNPYQTVHIYGNEVMERLAKEIARDQTLPPHVFSISAKALHLMKTEGVDQSVLISGESGSGKTESTKKILTYLSNMSASSGSVGKVSVEDQILDSNPLLESFGNAKTIRNNNSSRFGKYMEVNFDNRNRIKGCNVTAYLLEKSRVVRQNLNERNYHIFYMLLEGANADMRKEFSLKPPEHFFYLCQSGCTTIDRRSEMKEYEEYMTACESLGIEPEMRFQIMQCLAGLLHLGNLSFSASSDDGCTIMRDSVSNIDTVASLLGIRPGTFSLALTFKETTVRGDTTLSPLEPAKAIDQRDALAKHIYGILFDEIVSLVNKSLYRGKHGRSIGVLDIFGFEVFKVNSLEQLCINYCNERLQTFFNEIIFESELKTYTEERVPVDDIKYQDNTPCVRLIDLKGASIFAFLDDEINVPGGQDNKFANKLHQIFDENKVTKSEYYGRNRRQPTEFIVKHFAGDVTYIVTDFMEKNKDTLAPGLLRELTVSEVPVIKRPAEEQYKAQMQAQAGGGGRTSPKKSSKLTLTAKFKMDLDALMTALRKTTPHFIRCVKPNDAQQPSRFDGILALNQLKYSGLFEAIRIRKSGYALRMTHAQFVKRYKLCCPKVILGRKPDFKAAAMGIIDTLRAQMGDEISPEGKRMYALGTTRVFLRVQEIKNRLEAYRNSQTFWVVLPIQALARGYICRCATYDMMGKARKDKEAAMRRQQIIWDGMIKADEESRRYRDEEKRIREEAAELQRKLFAAKQEKMQEIMFDSAVLIQKNFRGMRGRVKGKSRMCSLAFKRAFAARDDKLLRKAAELPQKLNVHSNHIRKCQVAAKELILEIIHETYVVNELTDAIRCRSIDLLIDALTLAEDSSMTFPVQYAEAKILLQELLHRRTILDTLAGILEKCTTIPILLDKADKIKMLCQAAADMGLGSSDSVSEALIRVQKIERLIRLRDRIRYAVEVCSPGEMLLAMKELQGLTKVFGKDLMAEEAKAVRGMMRMTHYENSLIDLGEEDDLSNMPSYYDSEDDEDDLAGVDNKTVGRRQRGSVDEPRSVWGQEEYGADAVADEEVLAGDAALVAMQADEEQLETDTRLPPFVMQQLEKLGEAASREDLHAAVEHLKVLVPADKKRKEFVRVFRWVMTYATWRTPAKQVDELSIMKEHRKKMSERGEGGEGIEGGEGVEGVEGVDGSDPQNPQETKEFFANAKPGTPPVYDEYGKRVRKQMDKSQTTMHMVLQREEEARESVSTNKVAFSHATTGTGHSPRRARSPRKGRTWSPTRAFRP